MKERQLTLLDFQEEPVFCAECNRRLPKPGERCRFCNPRTVDQGVAEGVAAREAAYESTTEDWRTRADQAVRILAVSGEFFISNALWDHVDRPREPRAAGGVWMRAKRDGVVEDTGRIVPHPERHGAPTIVWRSLIFSGTRSDVDAWCKRFRDGGKDRG